MPIRLLPEGSDLAAARAALSEHLEVRAGRIRAATTTFYDTFDGRVRAEGLTVRHAGGRLALERRDTREVLASAEATAAPRLFAEDLPDGFDLDDALEMRALTPLARVRTRVLPLAVLNRDQKTVVRLTVETHMLGHTPLHGRVGAAAVRGYDRELEAVERVLAETLSWPEATVALVDEAAAASGRDPAGTSAKLNCELDPAAPAHRGRRDRLRRGCWRSSPTTSRARSRTSTRSSCTTCASRSAARAPCSASSSRSIPSACNTTATSSSACRPSPATCATSTSTCSTSRPCAPRSRSRCRPTWTRCGACSRPAGHVR